MNNIIYGERCIKWCEQHDITIDKWNIPDAEIKRIIDLGIRITIFYSPASMLEIKEPINAGYLIIADASQLAEEILEKNEFIACLLHDIGHILNQPTGMSIYLNGFDNIYEEYFADEYACRCGYKKYILSAMDKLEKRFPKTFEKEKIGKRRLKILENHADK